MEFDWKQITHFRKVQVVSIEFTEQGVIYNWVQLKRSKGEVQLIDSKDKLNAELICDQIISSIPILIHVIGKGVLNKITDPNEDYIEIHLGKDESE